MSVSWLMPVRNGGAWLQRAVHSGLACCASDDEFIVVDDGSTDDPRQHLPSDRRIRFFQQPPLGIVAALEHGRAKARGAYIARLDCDDVALPGRIEAQLAAFSCDPQLGAVGGQAVLDDALGEGMQRYVHWVNSLSDLTVARLIESPLFHPAVTFRADAVAAVGGYRDGDFPEDYDLWLRLVAAGWRIANVDLPVVRLQDRTDRLTRTDPRYRRNAFLTLKMAHLAETVLRKPSRVAVWGVGRSGRPWIRWLLAQGHQVVLLVDVGTAQNRQGIPVSPPQALAGVELDLLIVAVGARGARAQIRTFLTEHRADLREGEGWIAVC